MDLKDTKFFDNLFQKNLLKFLSQTSSNKPHTKQFFKSWHDLPVENFNNFPLKIDKEGQMYLFLSALQKINALNMSFIQLSDMLNEDNFTKTSNIFLPYLVRLIDEEFNKKNSREEDGKTFLPNLYRETEAVPMLILPNPYERKLILVKDFIEAPTSEKDSEKLK